MLQLRVAPGQFERPWMKAKCHEIIHEIESKFRGKAREVLKIQIREATHS